MSISSVARQPQGIPVGGQFAATTHAEPQLSLVAAEPKSALEIEDALAELSPEDASFVRHQLRLFERAEIAGRISDIDMDGGAYRAKLTTEDGIEFGFEHAGSGIDIWRENALSGDHSGMSDIYRSAGDLTMGLTGDELKAAYGDAHTNAQIADAWNTYSSVRSNKKVLFGLPRVTEDGEAEMEFTIGSDDRRAYRMVVPRGSTEARVFDSEDEELSPRMAKAVLEDAAEAAGEKPDAGSVIFSATRSLEPIVEGTW